MAKLFLLFALLASAFAGHWQEWMVFRKECGQLQRRCVADNYGESKENPVCVEKEEPCSGQKVLFSSSEEALTKLSKTIYLKIGSETKKVPVMVSEDGTNYLIFQRRLNGEVEFYRNWADYVNGFGNPEGEYWIGLNALNKLTSDGKFVLTIFLQNFKDKQVFARYSTFRVGGPETYYQLTVGGYSGTAGDAMGFHNNMKFTTNDKDNDNKIGDNCAVMFKGAWWYRDCHVSNLNGHYYADPGHHSTYADGINWDPFMGFYDSMKRSIMALSLK